MKKPRTRKVYRPKCDVENDYFEHMSFYKTDVDCGCDILEFELKFVKLIKGKKEE